MAYLPPAKRHEVIADRIGMPAGHERLSRNDDVESLPYKLAQRLARRRTQQALVVKDQGSLLHQRKTSNAKSTRSLSTSPRVAGTEISARRDCPRRRWSEAPSRSNLTALSRRATTSSRDTPSNRATTPLVSRSMGARYCRRGTWSTC